MSNKAPQGWQIPAINPFFPYVQESFDLKRMDAFVKSLGAEFYHWKASTSPIGLADRGDYRRNEGVDVITSNGYVYTFGGKFTATMTGNQKDQSRPSEGALIDASTSYLVLPRFYDDKSDQPIPSAVTPGGCGPTEPCEPPKPLQEGPIGEDCSDCENVPNRNRIRLTPGDRLYHDPTIDDLVVNKELMTFSANRPNVPMFPIVKMDAAIIDSRGIFYNQGENFIICEGNIEWLDGKPNPGFDPDSGLGRTYSIRYLYRAYYYVTRILREVRITEVTAGNVRTPERMPMFVEIMREYIYHNINRGNETNNPPSPAMQPRQVPQTPEKIAINEGTVLVEMTNILNED